MLIDACCNFCFFSRAVKAGKVNVLFFGEIWTEFSRVLLTSWRL